MIHISSMLMSSVGGRLEKSQVIQLRNRFVLGRNIFIIVFVPFFKSLYILFWIKAGYNFHLLKLEPSTLAPRDGEVFFLNLGEGSCRLDESDTTGRVFLWVGGGRWCVGSFSNYLEILLMDLMVLGGSSHLLSG